MYIYLLDYIIINLWNVYTHASECSVCCMRLFTGVDAVTVCPCNWQPVFSKHTSNDFRDWNFSSQILHEKLNIHSVIIKVKR